MAYNKGPLDAMLKKLRLRSDDAEDGPAIVSSRHSQGARMERETWDNHIEYVLSSLGDCVGLGNVWRFPFMIFENGGGVFLIPYVLLLVFGGYPLFMIESTLGQFSRGGPIAAFNIIPICRGVGWIAVINAAYFSVYYIMFLVYTTKYFFLSFSKNLPWKECWSMWGAESNCKRRDEFADALNNASMKLCPEDMEDEIAGVTCLHLVTPAEQFWKIEILHEDADTGLGNLGGVQTDLVLLLLGNWIILFMCMFRGIKTSGKVVYFSVLFPYVVLFGLMFYGLSLPGAMKGLRYLFTPDWSRLGDYTVWSKALGQMFFSISLGLGGVIMYGSYNKFGNKLQRDVPIITFIDFGTSMLASISVFTFLGFLATNQNVEIPDVARKGYSLMFHIMPEALVRTNVAQIWTISLFLMVYTLGVDSAFVSILTILSVLKDQFEFVARHPILSLAILCSFMFLLGLPFCTKGGLILGEKMDEYVADIGLIFCVFAEVVTVAWFYGAQRYSEDLEYMMGMKPNWFFKICWWVIDPVVVFVLLVFSCVEFEGFKPNEEASWVVPVGTVLFMSTIVPVPAVALYVVFQHWKKKIPYKAMFVPRPNWGPNNEVLRNDYLVWREAKNAEPREMQHGGWLKKQLARLKGERQTPYPVPPEDPGTAEER